MSRTATHEHKCSCGGPAQTGGVCAACRKKPVLVYDVLRYTGRPLDSATRVRMESRLGHDFSNVRVHTGAQAAASAQAVGARAWTLRNHIAFGTGKYEPRTAKGQGLLSHELTHVVQQSRNPGLGMQLAPNSEEWMQDRNGNLYYRTREEAERRKRTLEAEGEWTEYRIASFKQDNDTFWRVEMRGPKAATPEEDEAREAETAPASPQEAETNSTKSTANKKICLTFDDGPQSGTEEVLDTLKSKSAKGTFFLTGINMAGNPTQQRHLVERMINEGHQIANHTYTHKPAAKADYLTQYGDLSDSAKEAKFHENFTENRQHFESLFQPSTTKFPGFSLARLPGDGRFVQIGGKHVYVEATEKLGMKHVTWHFEYAKNGDFGHLKVPDWKGVSGVAAELDRYPRNNEIILFHDRHWQGMRGKTLFDNLLTHLKSRSFSFGQLSGEGSCS